MPDLAIVISLTGGWVSIPCAQSITMPTVMGVPRRGGLLAVLLVGVGAAAWWLWELYRAPNRADLSAYWQLVVAVAAIAVAVITLYRDSLAPRTPGGGGGSELDRVADRLADAVEQQWTEAARTRRLLQPEPIAVRWAQPAKPVAISAAAATASTRFPPIPGLTATRQEQLRQGGLRDLHTVYGGLRSGRMVIVGAPGSGKSGAAVLLVLAALQHRQSVPDTDRGEVPVPVLFTLHDWDPSTQPVRDWLVSQLRQTYDGLLNGTRGVRHAARLIDQGKITVVLDGLDEIIEQLRPLALQALSEQALFRLIVLARSAEMAGAAEQTILDGAVAVELQDVDPGTAADYLTRIQRDPPPHRWQELTELLRTAPDSPLARALSNPLTLTLVRDTYRAGDSIGDLLDWCANTEQDVSREGIEDHLLGRVLPQAYTPRPGQPPPRYTLATAQRTLALIAARLSHERTRDLAWWRIPTWIPTMPRIVTIGLAIGLTVTLGLELFMLASGILGRGFVLMAGLGGVLGAWLASRWPPRTASTRWRFIFSHPSRVFVLGLVCGPLVMVISILVPTVRFPGLGSSLIVWASVCFVVASAIWLVVGLSIWLLGKTRHRKALMRWRLVHWHPSVVFGAGLGFGFLGTAVSATGVIGFFGFAVLIELGLGLWFGLTRLGGGAVSPLPPIASWRQNRVAALGIWLLLGLHAGLLPMLGFGILNVMLEAAEVPLAIAATVGLGLVSGLMLGLILPESWSTSLACALLALRWRSPIRLMHFLDDARERNILRTIGPVYQFRHARLQDHLARLAISATPATKSGTEPRAQAAPAVPHNSPDP